METQFNTQRPAFNSEAMTNKLSAMFRGATRTMLFTNTNLQKLQVKFCYFIDDIQRGPAYDQSKLSMFVLQWINDIGRSLTEAGTNNSSIDSAVRRLLQPEYEHRNYYI
jgi:hypothetical protein